MPARVQTPHQMKPMAGQQMQQAAHRDTTPAPVVPRSTLVTRHPHNLATLQVPLEAVLQVAVVGAVTVAVGLVVATADALVGVVQTLTPMRVVMNRPAPVRRVPTVTASHQLPPITHPR